MNTVEIQEFYFKKGFKEASEKYYRKGYKQAVYDIKKELEAFKTRHEAIEASKYLSLTGKITHAEVIKFKDNNGGSKIKIIPPKVEKEFDVYDLIKVPEALELEDNMLDNKDLKNSGVNPNAFYGQEEYVSNNNKGLIQDASKINEENSIEVEKTRKYKQILDIADIQYSEGASNYRVMFRSPFEKEIFCSGVGAPLCQ